jgi:hypothetical protein
LSLSKVIPGYENLTERLEEKDKIECARAILSWFEKNDNKNWLLVYDNVDLQIDPKPDTDSHNTLYDLSDWFPRVPHGAILIRTRLQSLSTLGRSIALGKLPSKEPWLLLQQYYQALPAYSPSEGDDKSGDVQYSQAKSILNRLGGLPLAITQAGAYIQHTGTSLKDYLTDYDASWLQLVEELPTLRDYGNGPIHSSFMISFRHVQVELSRFCSLSEVPGILRFNNYLFGL